MINILEALARNTLISDGAMGTMLQGLGMPSGVSPEVWMLSNQDKILEVMSAYVRAGAEIIETNTFGASRLKLAEYGHENDVHLINTMAVSLAKRAAGADCYVAGVIGPSGRFPSPVGDTAMEDLIEVFAQQAQSISQGGADLILLQTFPDLGEARAAYLGARMATTLPVAVSLTYAANQRTLTGADPATAAVVFTALGADLLGVNCSTGPEEMLPIIEIYRNHSRLPLLAEPNAGVPYLEDGHTVFPMSPTDMAGYAHLFLAAGVRYLGGCCGTTPEHIRAIAGEAKSAPPPRPSIAASSAPSQTKFSHTAPSQTEPSHTAPSRSALASLSKTIYLGAGFPPRLIGERLNPTGRKVIANAITERDFGAYASEGRAQQQSGADLLDVNVGFAGSAGGNEAESMVMAICNIQQSVDCPLIIDSVDPYVIRQALIHYQGKALINSVNGKETSLQAILPLAKQYGAAVLGLTLDEAGVPADADTRFAIAERILSRALALGVPREDVYIDCLVMASAADPWQAAETLKAVSMIKEKLGLITVLGVSNISHGMPRRPWLNQVFLAQCIAAGVDAVMVNPLDPATRPTIAAAAFLAGRDPQGVNYIRLARNDPANSGEDPASTNDPTATIPAPLS
ncbi:MAG: homocysteine S-methyltransferase family protein, partial [Clostridiales bacterium]|nr:homocysteine S-methyltransferase family protein [Clostridiales bacterium]